MMFTSVFFRTVREKLYVLMFSFSSEVCSFSSKYIDILLWYAALEDSIMQILKYLLRFESKTQFWASILFDAFFCVFNYHSLLSS